MKKFKLVKVDYNYCDYLRKFDEKGCYNYRKKELRPYLEILFKMNNCEYFALLTSPKEKLSNLEFIKIDNGNLGAINFNNMIRLLNNVIRY